MNLVIDTNLVISGLITPNGTISKLILKDLPNSKLICPKFLLDELNDKFEKIKKITGLSDGQVKEMTFHFLKRIDFIEDDLIDFEYQNLAYNLVHDVDKKDLLFVALALQTGYILWTGDKKLIKGITSKGFDQIITTNELLKISRLRK